METASCLQDSLTYTVAIIYCISINLFEKARVSLKLMLGFALLMLPLPSPLTADWLSSFPDREIESSNFPFGEGVCEISF